MKKYLKSTILTMVIILFGVLSFIYFQNRDRDHQPEKAKLVIGIGGQWDEEYE